MRPPPVVVVGEGAADADVVAAFPRPVARVSPPPPEHVGPASKRPKEAERKPLRRKVVGRVGLAPLVGESFPR